MKHWTSIITAGVILALATPAGHAAIRTIPSDAGSNAGPRAIHDAVGKLPTADRPCATALEGRPRTDRQVRPAKLCVTYHEPVAEPGFRRFVPPMIRPPADEPSVAVDQPDESIPTDLSQWTPL
jgi:hypothetical protein